MRDYLILGAENIPSSKNAFLSAQKIRQSLDITRSIGETIMIKKLIISSIKAGLTLTILFAFSANVQAEEQKPLEVLGTPWKLMKLQGQQYKTPAGAPTPFIKLLPDNKKVVGNTGCNNFGGTYTQEGDKLTFSLVLSTKQSCPQTADMDVRFLSAMKEANRFKREGAKMKLYNGDKVIANFDEITKDQLVGMEAEKK